MEGNDLREALQLFVPSERVEELSKEVNLVQRVRKLDVQALVVSLVLTAGSDDSGRQADVYSKYLEESGQLVVRGGFYAWFSDGLALLMTGLAREAMQKVWMQAPLLTGHLAGVKDWLLVDSETVTLPDELADDFPATSARAGLKIHKWFSLGRNNIVDVQITPARDHDAPQLIIGEHLRGMGLIVDLGYASKRLREVCSDGTVFSVEGEEATDHLLDLRTDETGGTTFDLDVAFGRGADRVEARLVGVPGTGGGYHWCITLLSRETHPPAIVCKLYRARWEIESDNKRDKSGARLDQIRGETFASVITLVYASLMRTILANYLVYIDLRDRPPTRAPLHGLALALALNTNHQLILFALEVDTPEIWERAARVLRARGHDPNWRRRPSILDELRGRTAPPGRPRRAKAEDCPPEARAYRSAAQTQTLKPANSTSQPGRPPVEGCVLTPYT